MARLPKVKTTDLPPELQKLVADRGRRAAHGPFTAWLHRPKLAERIAPMMAHFRRGGIALPPRLTELTILIAARMTTAQYAWYAHEPQARSHGVEEATIEAIRHRKKPVFKKEDEAAVYDLVMELLDEHDVKDATYDRVLKLLGQDQLIDVVTLAGFYSMIACTLIAFKVDLPEGEKLPLPV
jgi:4-carboxymuconolactone decarboxylase